MPETLFPGPIAGFTEYIKIAYAKARNSLTAYGDRLAIITPRSTTLSYRRKRQLPTPMQPKDSAAPATRPAKRWN